MAGSTARLASGQSSDKRVRRPFYILTRGDEAAARKHAQLAAEMNPRYWSFLLRDARSSKADYADGPCPVRDGVSGTL